MSKIRFSIIAVPNKEEIVAGDPYEVLGYADVDETHTELLEELLGPRWEERDYGRVD